MLSHKLVWKDQTQPLKPGAIPGAIVKLQQKYSCDLEKKKKCPTTSRCIFSVCLKQRRWRWKKSRCQYLMDKHASTVRFWKNTWRNRRQPTYYGSISLTGRASVTLSDEFYPQDERENGGCVIHCLWPIFCDYLVGLESSGPTYTFQKTIGKDHSDEPSPQDKREKMVGVSSIVHGQYFVAI